MDMITEFPGAYNGSGTFFQIGVSLLKSISDEFHRPAPPLPIFRDWFSGSGPLQSAIIETTIARPMVLPLSTHERVLNIVTFFGISKSQLSRILGVTRPTLYAWIDGSADPQTDNIGRINALYDILKAVDWDGHRPIFHGYVTAKLDGEAFSLIDLLAQPVLKQSDAERVALTAWNLTRERDRRLSADLSMPPTRTDRDDVLVDNLTALGTEG